MRERARIERMLALIGEIWKSSPDLRLGQLIENARTFSRNDSGAATFHVEDSIVEEGLVEWLDKRRSS